MKRLTSKQLQRMKIVLMGGEGSGFFAPEHQGRPGKRGGSASEKGSKVQRRREDARRFRDNLDINEWQRDHKDDLFPSTITKTQREILDNYKRDSIFYRPLNTYLRGGEYDQDASGWENLDDMKKGISEIDAAIASSQIPEDVITYRGMPSEMLPKNAEGMEFIDNGYGSTSLDLGTAHKFARWTREDGYTPALIEINVPKGYDGLYMDTLWDNSEKELLLPRGTKYKITKDYEKPFYGGNIRFLEVEVIP